MPDFDAVSPHDFCALIASHGSQALVKQFARYECRDPQSWPLDEAMVWHGSLRIEGDFKPPCFNTLIVGNLDVSGFLDCEDAQGYDEGGVLVVIGNVTCTRFAGHFGKCVFIDGNLHAPEFLLNAFADSALVVCGDLTTGFFYGRDIWAEVGGRANMPFGDGYCLPFDYIDAGRQAIEPAADAESSRQLLVLPDVDEDHGLELMDLMRAGQPLLRRS